MKIKIAIAVVIIIVAALLAATPLTRNVLREEMGLAPYPVVASNYLAQLAQADELSQNSPNTDETARLRKFIARYPNRPEGYALLLVRKQQVSIGGMPSQKAAQKPETKQFLIDIETARKIDPSNGFFLTEKAIWLASENRNSQALSCIASASQCPKWDDYTTSLYLGRAKNAEASRGWLCATDNINAFASMLFPQYSGYRGLATHLVQTAIDSEQAGEIDKEYRIRKIVYAFGQNLVARSYLAIGVFVGTSIENIAIEYSIKPSASRKQIRSQAQDRYINFLRSNGRINQANEMEEAKEETKNTHDDMFALLRNMEKNYATPPMSSFAIDYIYLKLLIIGTAFALVLAALFGMIRKLAEQIEKQPWAHPAIGRLIGAILMIGLVIFIWGMDFSRLGFIYGQSLHHYNEDTLFELIAPPQLFVQIDSIVANQTNSGDRFDPAHITNYPNIFLEIVLMIQFVIAMVSISVSKWREQSGFLAFSASFRNSSLVAVPLFVCAYVAILPLMLNNNQKANWHIAHNMPNEVQ